MFEEKKCVCDGKETIQFRGRGFDLQYMVCPMVGTEGHKTHEECDKELKEKRMTNYPKSGRFA
jgi:hypothetical protein